MLNHNVSGVSFILISIVPKSENEAGRTGE